MKNVFLFLLIPFEQVLHAKENDKFMFKSVQN